MHSQSDMAQQTGLRIFKIAIAQSLHVRLQSLLQTCDEAIAELFCKCPGISCALHETSAVARVSEAPPEISRGAPHTLLAYYYELQ